jgi:diacylglycerol kinase family enzyme
MVRVFFNPRAGARVPLADRIHEHLPGATVFRLTRSLDLAALAHQDPLEIPWVAAGGDGTIHAVANAILRSGLPAPRPLGILPLGTLNHLARDLKLPLDLALAAKVIRDGHTRPVDAAQVLSRSGSHIFLNNSSLGAYPAMVLDRDRMRRSGRSRWPALLLASLRAFLRFRRLTVEMTAETRRLTCVTPFLFVGNNRYCVDPSEGFAFGQREELDRATLALYLAPGATRPAILRMALAALAGRLKDAPEYQEHLVPRFTVHVHGRRRLRVSMDGEVRRLFGPLEYRTLPAALRILTPP